ncbi:hypothetical protein DICPUDRAFT_81648 [Dictyostelium purpureum]|uniref:Transmembrane protein 53 n=1 Tax=Dictyostelium purpureum TaxID=5786 RepID=F0ZU57_DICPU|nr:uncharacterized protein DICPUDRAFT_81648 [Dictyostelium purpureum]EGC32527.1 hypothetical protein DICPUDRAFT_81648 [Dictyostelium purpureum]|eukprot:XP_003290939.1 hypothetical protein DICPUDRAFT_81648 [Dictyostelium purpureum]
MSTSNNKTITSSKTAAHIPCKFEVTPSIDPKNKNNHLTFIPTDKNSNNPNLSIIKKSADDDMESRPLCIVLGWMGSTQKLLIKYINLWTSRGFNTLSYRADYFEILSIFGIRRKAEVMLKQIANYLKERPNCDSVIFHIFSNGGGFLYWTFIEYMLGMEEYKSIHPMIKGVVMDSLPTFTNKQLFTGFWTLAKPMGGGIGTYMALPLTAAVWFPYFVLYRKYLTHPKNQYVHTILYSTDDKLIPGSEVEEFIKRLKQYIRDDLIHIQHWEKSEHVSHLRHHTKDYIRNINQFLVAVQAEEKRKTLPQAKL